MTSKNLFELFDQMTACVDKQDRLTQMKNRALAQLAILDEARELISPSNQCQIWELGYGGGRTYDRLCTLFADNPITVFDNRPDGRERVESDANRFLYGDIFSTIPDVLKDKTDGVGLIHADIGTPNFDQDLDNYVKLGALVAPALAQGGLMASDRPIASENWTLLKSGLEFGWPYFLWRV